MSTTDWSTFMDNRYNPTNRYLIRAGIGDGGEMSITAYPECICDPDGEELVRNSAAWTGWVTVAEDEATMEALVAGVHIAEGYFSVVHKR